jgi:hypothetical protein
MAVEQRHHQQGRVIRGQPVNGADAVDRRQQVGVRQRHHLRCRCRSGRQHQDRDISGTRRIGLTHTAVTGKRRSSQRNPEPTILSGRQSQLPQRDRHGGMSAGEIVVKVRRDDRRPRPDLVQPRDELRRWQLRVQRDGARLDRDHREQRQHVLGAGVREDGHRVAFGYPVPVQLSGKIPDEAAELPVGDRPLAGAVADGDLLRPPARGFVHQIGQRCGQQSTGSDSVSVPSLALR